MRERRTGSKPASAQKKYLSLIKIPIQPVGDADGDAAGTFLSFSDQKTIIYEL